MKISLFWTSRKRVSQLSFSIASFMANADNNKDIEYLFAIDDDDLDTEKALSELKPFAHTCGTTIKVVKTERLGYDYMDVYTNKLANIADGDCWIIITDDMFCLTPGWDTLIRNDVKPYINEPILIQTQPVEDRSKFWPTMPGITKKWFDITKRVSAWVAQDIYLVGLADEAGLKIVRPNYEVHQLSRIYAGQKENWTKEDETHREGRGHNISGGKHRSPKQDKMNFHKEDESFYKQDLKKLKEWKSENK